MFKFGVFFYELVFCSIAVRSISFEMGVHQNKKRAVGIEAINVEHFVTVAVIQLGFSKIPKGSSPVFMQMVNISLQLMELVQEWLKSQQGVVVVHLSHASV